VFGHTNTARGSNLDTVLTIHKDLKGFVSCWPDFKPTQEECDTCDRHDLMDDPPEYDDPNVMFQGNDILGGAECAPFGSMDSK
jgi:hypothetical protein